MSIIWLESFFDHRDDTNIFAFQSLNIVIYLNMISCLCFVIYCMLHSSDKNMQKPPSKYYKYFFLLDTLIILKMFAECMISFHLLVVFLCFTL